LKQVSVAWLFSYYNHEHSPVKPSVLDGP